MKRSKPYFLKRIIAYLIDLIIIVLLSGILSTLFIKGEKYENYQNEQRKQFELMQSYSEGKITKEEYNTESDNITYYLAKDGVVISIVTCSVIVVYYVILCYYCGGITLGKYIMKLRIVSANEKKLNLGNFFLRSLFINMILSNLLSIGMVLIFDKDTFIKIYPKASMIFTIFMVVTLIFVMYREDGRGLHDLIANTKIISTKKMKDEQEEVKEAVVVEKKNKKKKDVK